MHFQLILKKLQNKDPKSPPCQCGTSSHHLACLGLGGTRRVNWEFSSAHLLILLILILILILILLILSQVWVWGGNTEGQLGLGEEAQENVFTPNQLLIQDQVIPRIATFSWNYLLKRLKFCTGFLDCVWLLSLCLGNSIRSLSSYVSSCPCPHISSISHACISTYIYTYLHVPISSCLRICISSYSHISTLSRRPLDLGGARWGQTRVEWRRGWSHW